MPDDDAGDRSPLDRIRELIVDIYRRAFGDRPADDTRPADGPESGETEPTGDGEGSDDTESEESEPTGLGPGDGTGSQRGAEPVDVAGPGGKPPGNREPETQTDHDGEPAPESGTGGSGLREHADVGELPDALRAIGVLSTRETTRVEPPVLERRLAGDRLSPRDGIDPVVTDVPIDPGIGYRRDRTRLSFLARPGVPFDASRDPRTVAPGTDPDRATNRPGAGRGERARNGPSGRSRSEPGPDQSRSGTPGPPEPGSETAGADADGQDTGKPTRPEASTEPGTRDTGAADAVGVNESVASDPAGPGDSRGQTPDEPGGAAGSSGPDAVSGRRIDRRIADAAARTPREDPWPAGPRKAPGHPDRSPPGRSPPTSGHRGDDATPGDTPPSLRFGTVPDARDGLEEGLSRAPGRRGERRPGRTGSGRASEGSSDDRSTRTAADRSGPGESPAERTDRPAGGPDDGGSRDRSDDRSRPGTRSEAGARSPEETGMETRSDRVERREGVDGSASSGRTGRRHLRVDGRPWPLGTDDAPRNDREHEAAGQRGERRSGTGSGRAEGSGGVRVRRSPSRDRPPLRLEPSERTGPGDGGGPASSDRPERRAPGRTDPGPAREPGGRESSARPVRPEPGGTASRRRDHRVTGTARTTSGESVRRRSGPPDRASGGETRARPGASDRAFPATRTRAGGGRRSADVEGDGPTTVGGGSAEGQPSPDREVGPMRSGASGPGHRDRSGGRVGGETDAGARPPRLATLVERRNYGRGSTRGDATGDDPTGASAFEAERSADQSAGVDRSVAARTRWAETVTAVPDDGSPGGETDRQQPDDPDEPVELSTRASKPPEKRQEDKMPRSTLEPGATTDRSAGPAESGRPGGVRSPDEPGRPGTDAVTGPGGGDDRRGAESVDGSPGFPDVADRAADRGGTGRRTGGPGIGRDRPSMDLARPAPSVDRTTTDHGRSGRDDRDPVGMTSPETGTGGRDRTHRPAPVEELFAPGGPENPGFDAELDRVVDELYRRIERRMRIERERRGL